MSFWASRMTLRPTDKEFSKYIRLRDKGCVFKIKCNGNVPFEKLTCSHFHGRRKESVRFDEANCRSSCRACHLYLDEHKGEYKRIMIQILGEREYNLLQIRAETPKKRDDIMQKLVNKALLESIKEENE